MRDEEYRAIYELEDQLWWYSGMRSIVSSLLDFEIRQNDQLRILDVGCGTGHSMLWLGRILKAACFGVDRSLRAAGLWRQRGIQHASIASANALPFEGGSFDLLTCLDVIYQFEEKEALEALQEYRRVLKPGGILLIREPAYNWLRGSHDIAVGTRHRFTRHELISKLSVVGFNVRRATYANSLLLWLALPYRLLSGRGNQGSDVKPMPALVNRLFESALNVEAALIRHVNLPAGLSVLVLAERV